MTDPRFTRAVSGFLYVNQENEIPVSLSGDNISLTLCDRNSITDNLGNYFISLNLPYKESEFPQNSSMFFFYPELQQLNVDKILLIKVPSTAYTEYIDARSIKLNLPATGSTANFYTLFSSTYSDTIPNKHGERSPLLGDNIAYLFSDIINSPYTGKSITQLGQIISGSGVTSWNASTGNYRDRPSATAYGEVKAGLTINTDRRYRMNKTVFTDGLSPDYRGNGQSFYNICSAPYTVGFFSSTGYGLYVKPQENFFSTGNTVFIERFDKSNTSYNNLSGNCTVVGISADTSTNKFFEYSPDPNYGGPWDVIIVNRLPAVTPPTLNDEAGYIFAAGGTYYNYDIPVGFAVLDKGLIAITHQDIVNSIDWASGYLPDGSPNTLAETNNIYFTDINTSIYGAVEPSFSLDFTTLDFVLKIRATCNALLNSFYISNNPTWDNAMAQNPMSSNMKVAITEVGLYNRFNELVAVAKFSEPVYKGADDLLTFELDINL